MEYGFSYMGFLFVVLLVGPSLRWVNLTGYDRYRAGKKGIFQGLERIGLTLSICVSLIFRNYDYQGPGSWLTVLILAWAALAGFEVHWSICCRKKQMPGRLGKIPLTVLSPLAFFLLGMYGRSLPLMGAAILYGIGHVGGGQREAEKDWNCCCCGDSCKK